MVSLPIKKGDVLKVVLKNGETIEKFKVKKIKPEMISGIESKPTKNKHQMSPWDRAERTIATSEIKSIQKRKFSLLRSFGVTVAGVAIGLLIIFPIGFPLTPPITLM